MPSLFGCPEMLRSCEQVRRWPTGHSAWTWQSRLLQRVAVMPQAPGPHQPSGRECGHPAGQQSAGWRPWRLASRRRKSQLDSARQDVEQLQVAQPHAPALWSEMHVLHQQILCHQPAVGHNTPADLLCI